MKHITKVRELYEETIHWISESEDSWKNFLVFYAFNAENGLLPLISTK